MFCDFVLKNSLAPFLIKYITMPEASGENPGPSSSSNARIPNAITTGINKLRDKFRIGRQVQEGEIF